MEDGRALALCALLISLQGCGALPSRPVPPSHGITLAATLAETEEAIRALLGDTPVHSPAPGALRTGWIEGWSERSFGLLQRSWKRRVRLTVRMEPSGEETLVSVRGEMQEKAPGGGLSLRWRRAPPDGNLEREFFEELRKKVSHAS